MAKKKKRPAMSRLEHHTRSGKILLPPYKTLPSGVQFSSWRDSRMPNFLWSVLLSGSLDREKYLDIFRRIARSSDGLSENAPDSLSHADLSGCENEVFDTIFQSIIHDKIALEALSPLLIFETLPDRNHWLRHIKPSEKPEFDKLAYSIANVLDHQSEQSTDCRWMRILYLIAIEKLSFAPTMRTMVENILNYPNSGDLRSVRPSIRAAEMGLDMDAKDNKWPENFWEECYKYSGCITLKRREAHKYEQGKTAEDLMRMYALVADHALAATNNTSVNAKRDSAVGLTLYAISLAATTAASGGHQRAEGRHALRTLTESLITLRYLSKLDNESIWLKYRQYGTGQAKLAFLKLFDLEDNSLPSYANIDDLDAYSDEDYWQEFVEISIGNWSGKDLRRMSEEAGVKDIYDKYYGWPSGYIHAHWGAVRDTVFDQCINPLHRLHRVPAKPNFLMESTLPDIVKLVNLHLDVLNTTMPTFKPRLHLEKAAD